MSELVEVFFRNFTMAELEQSKFKEKCKTIHTAYYLEELGFKGKLQIGNARVSEKHANMIVTLPTATSSDIVALVRHMQNAMLEQYDLLPTPECQLIGFKTYPFLILKK